MYHTLGGYASLNCDAETFPCILVHDVQNPKSPAVMGSRRHHIVAPDVIFSLGPQPDARAVVEPEPSSPRLSLRYFESFLPPDPLHPFVIYLPAFPDQKGRYPPVAIPSILGRQFSDAQNKSLFLTRRPRTIALCRSSLPQNF